ncbi:MAG: exodeoxyribonuclease III [Oscillospiraceae bacterium]|jgi:exodeoxyribonuclease-3|nr:exodeoxyribonuclease III [Oscillospiraceae bacterium]
MRLVSWNVNGFRACVKKGFFEFFDFINADVFCVQETKMQRSQMDFKISGYYQFCNDAEKKGYSGVLVFSKLKPLNVLYGFESKEHPCEGRIVVLEYEKFFLINVYSPNSQRELLRLEYRMKWEDAFRNYLISLSKVKPLVLCGDLNVAHNEIDLKNPRSNRFNAGFTDQERQKFSKLLSEGFVDTFRYKYPNKENAYTWWSYMRKARDRNIGWRIDYFLTFKVPLDKIKDSIIHEKVFGSDHCPIELQIMF